MIEINGRPHYTAAQAAKLLGYADERPVLRGIRAGQIAYFKRPDGRYFIPASFIESMVAPVGGDSEQQINS